MPAPSDPRVTKLEEHAAFSERTIEQLSAEITELNRRCRVLTERLASLEQRLGKLVEDGVETEG
ncbi:MAG: SlyX family protein [Pyrinomonadaceae bacterium]|nr:SlyX family protein [Phycisphaerales bacterium]